MNESVLREIGVREDSASWKAIQYMTEKNIPMGVAARAFAIPVCRFEITSRRYFETLAARHADGRNVWAAAQNLTIEEFEKWWVNR